MDADRGRLAGHRRQLRRPGGRAHRARAAGRGGRAIRASADARCWRQRVSPACRALRHDEASGCGRGDTCKARAGPAARAWRRRTARPARAAMRRISLALLAVMWALPLGGAPPPEISFTDVTASANVAFTHVNGASPEKHLPETMGSGGAFVD